MRAMGGRLRGREVLVDGGADSLVMRASDMLQRIGVVVSGLGRLPDVVHFVERGLPRASPAPQPLHLLAEIVVVQVPVVLQVAKIDNLTLLLDPRVILLLHPCQSQTLTSTCAKVEIALAQLGGVDQCSRPKCRPPLRSSHLVTSIDSSSHHWPSRPTYPPPPLPRSRAAPSHRTHPLRARSRSVRTRSCAIRARRNSCAGERSWRGEGAVEESRAALQARRSTSWESFAPRRLQRVPPRPSVRNVCAPSSNPSRPNGLSRRPKQWGREEERRGRPNESKSPWLDARRDGSPLCTPRGSKLCRPGGSTLPLPRLGLSKHARLPPAQPQLRMSYGLGHATLRLANKVAIITGAGKCALPVPTSGSTS